MPHLDGVSATVCIRDIRANLPIIAMTSNIRADDIEMYFRYGSFFLPFNQIKEKRNQWKRIRRIKEEKLTYKSKGMNDVLPKPFTKDGMLRALEKHLPQFRKESQSQFPHPLQQQQQQQPTFPQPGQHAPLNLNMAQLTAPQPLKDDITSPVKSSPATAWHSPSQLTGPASAGFMQHPGAGGGVRDAYLPPGFQPQPQPGMSGVGVGGVNLGNARQGHRRGMSDMSPAGGAPVEESDLKRQRMFPPGPGGFPQ